MKNKPLEPLFELVAQMEADKVIANQDKGKEMIKKLRELAEEYTQLEFQTQRAVRTIRSYGRACQYAAEDFLEDGDVGELLKEFGNIEETKTSLKEALQNHTNIK